MQSILATGGSLQKRKEYIAAQLNKLSISQFDRIFLPAANSVKIEQVRYLIRELHKKPVQKRNASPTISPLRAGIILETEKATIAAQNALLKLLEEPPATACLFLAAPNPQHLLPTIVSRCKIVRLAFDNPGLDKLVAKQMRTLFGTLKTPDAIASGGVGAKEKLAQRIALYFEFAEQLGKTREAADQFLQDALLYLRQEYLKTDGAFYNAKNSALKIARKLLLARRLLAANVNPRQVLENLFMDL